MTRLALLLAGVLGLAGQAHAQAYQCRVPAEAPSIPAVHRDGPVRQTQVSGYTLALSWSPQFCRNAADNVQCSGRNGRFGLIVHGLWPDGSRGSWPQWCGKGGAVPAQTLRRHLCMMPSARLMARQWAKHGSCMTSSPDAYFKVTAILWQSLKLPDLDALARRKGLTAADLRRAMVRANPAIEPQAVAVILGRDGWLEEIRLCYARDFMPVRCGKGRTGAGDDAPVRIWRGL